MPVSFEYCSLADQFSTICSIEQQVSILQYIFSIILYIIAKN